MIEFKIVQNDGARPVMDEFGTLVAEGGVVFVGFDDEERRVAERAETPKFSGTPPIRKPGCHVGVFENPGQHRGGRRLAMRAGDAEHPAAPAARVRPAIAGRRCKAAFVEHGFKQRIATRNGVADDENVGLAAPVG
jgi:hypothetical protein